MDQRLQNYLHKSHFSRKNQSVVYLKKVTEVICKWPIGNRTICQNLIFLGRINLSMCETQKQKKNQTSAGRKFKIVQQGKTRLISCFCSTPFSFSYFVRGFQRDECVFQSDHNFANLKCQINYVPDIIYFLQVGTSNLQN